ncbi:MAG: hypothetical protein EBT49_09265 [Betaproteobacteria bacterium]|nr:hypothetical protein [Betaproteobacteria bacterium]
MLSHAFHNDLYGRIVLVLFAALFSGFWRGIPTMMRAMFPWIQAARPFFARQNRLWPLMEAP